MLRVGEERGGGGTFHDLACVHDGDGVGHAGDQSEVVADEQEGHAGLCLQFAQEAEDFGLHGDVECRGGFVGDQKVGFASQRHGDHHALALAAGHLVRVVIEAPGRIRNADTLECGDGAGPEVARRGFRLVGGHGLDDLRADRVRRVEAGHRLLEDHRDAPATDRAHRGGAQLQEILAIEDDGAACDPARRRDKAHDGERERRFSGAGFADDGEGAAALDREVDAGDRSEFTDWLQEIPCAGLQSGATRS